MNELVIPWQSLSDDALRGVIEDFVSREGTDYGHVEYSLDQKVEHVKAQLQNNEISIVFDAELDSCSIIAKSALYIADP
ncbi:MAG: hypothetical protein ACJA2O_002150 [Candidatus Azotimanducaceae bacterium]|jgi:uncharacterized protein YheU (UPF0270 family)